MEIRLRDYQQRVVSEIRDKASRGYRRILVSMPTGAGKTYTFSELAKTAVDKDNRVLALVHRRGLVEQMICSFENYGIDTGCIMAGNDTCLDAPCQVASIWTYARRIELSTLDENRFFINAPFVLIDEAHHIPAKTYSKVLKIYKDAFVVGFTATPTRTTGAGLGNFFDTIVNVVPMNELLAGGHLVPGVYYGPSEPDLEKIKTIGGDYSKKCLDGKLNNQKIIGDVVDNWFEYAHDKQTMVFAINRKHARALRDEFLRHGVSSEYLDAHNDDESRGDTIRRFKDGDTQVICQVALFTEGTDIPEIECVVIARPTKSIGLHRQILGRGARPSIGKDSFIVLDHGGNVRRLGFYEDEIMWTLDEKDGANKPKKPRKKEKTIMTCEMCHHLFTGKRCPKCGNEIKDYSKKIEAMDAKLISLKGENKNRLDRSDKQRWFRMFDYERRRLGKTYSWLLAQYKSKTGVWPRNMDNLPPLKPDNECKNWLTHQRIKWAKSRRASA